MTPRLAMTAGLLALCTPALAGKVTLRPVRVDSRAVLRPETNPTAVFELGVQAWRGERLKLDVNVGVAPARSLGMTGPLRRMSTTDGTVDLLAELGPWVETGPSAGVSFRLFRQQWTHIEELFIPVAGWRLNTTIVRTRTWSVQLTTKAMLDVTPTDFVRETAEVRRLVPIEGQVGLRVNLGHGRVRARDELQEEDERS